MTKKQEYKKKRLLIIEDSEEEEETPCPDCPICLEKIESFTKNYVTTECGHCFHTSCLMASVSHTGFGCPCCRTSMAKEVVREVDIPPEPDYRLVAIYEQIIRDTLLESRNEQTTRLTERTLRQNERTLRRLNGDRRRRIVL
jgi:hypothetical protein